MEAFGRIHGANLPERPASPDVSRMTGMVPASFLAKLRNNDGGVIEATPEEQAALRGERPGK